MRPSIVMIHGMWAAGWVWDEWVPIFERRGYDCCVPTLRHHDASPHEPPEALGSTSLLDYAADLERQIDALPGPPVLVGHSMGGMLAQMLAAHGRARAIVLLSPMPPQGINTLSPASLRMFRSTVLRWGFWRRPTRPDFADAIASMLGQMPNDERKTVYDRLVHESGRAGCEAGFWFLDPRRAKWVDPSRVTCPVLVVAGTGDRLHTPSMMRKVAARYDAVSAYLEFPDHGHWLVGEPGWRDIAEGVCDWLDERLAASPAR